MGSTLLLFTPLSITSPPSTKIRHCATSPKLHSSSTIIRPSHSLSQRTYIPSHVYTHPSAILLEICSDMKELYQILPLIIKNGLYNEHLFQTKLVSLFSKFGNLRDARVVFDPIADKIDALYHTLLKGHAKSSSLEEAVSFFHRMLYDDVRPVVYNFTYLLKICGDNSDLVRGKMIHSQLICNGFSSNVYAMTAVVNMYAKCRQINEAWKMFERMPQRDLVSWNAIIAGYAQNGLARRALELVLRMQKDGESPDSITVVTILPACADIGLSRIGKSIHGFVIRAGFWSLVNVSTALMNMYSKCGLVGKARLVFDRMQMRNVVSWNSMIDGYAESGNSEEAMVIFKKMMKEGVEPTDVTIMGALHACADMGDLEQGKAVHELSNRIGLASHASVTNSLIAMYSKCKKVDIAAELFKKLKNKTLVSWNAMILGYAQNGRVSEALDHFCKMQQENVQPDSFTMVSVISALADLSVLRKAKWIHGLIIRSYLDKNIFVMTALVDMYAKCGGVHMARKLFDVMEERHVMTWNSMIDGYGTHGLGQDAVELFEQMQKDAIKPNNVTFLCVLSACSHSGLVDEGYRCFTSMKQDYGLEPGNDHYGTMVDLLGRAGRLDEAWDFIQKMPIEPGISVFGAMLGACKIHKNVELAEKAAKRLFELDPEEGGYHVLLANIYSDASMWDNVAKVRKTMEKKGLQKTPGCSLVELKNEVHTFYSGSTSHPQCEKIYARLEMLVDEIKAVGYVPDTNSIHDVEDDVKKQLLNTHSEKLAIAFGLINTSPGTTIHIRKNLRVCGDCHNATKYISLVTGREIIVRDMHRFHHFKNGSCSCGDYW
ncbi:Pentatricopeptide repeat [Macleaya cordata]|uniref:Pentatricopeptide repeat n=1 Tax=Macleaya cordata TaxID=56857 RepID=A0A200R6E1_MACCD|nr:Pentatricopeptide repeat [Macleaya cordata]